MTAILVAGCSSAVNDTEFTEGAQETCQNLSDNIEMTEMLLDYGTKAEIYRAAADALDEIDFTAESAPQGYQLQTSLAALAEALEAFDQALEQAAEEAGLESLNMVMMTEEGSVFVSDTGSIFDMTKLNIDSELVMQVNASNDALAEAATTIGLETCAPEQLED